MKTKLLSRIFFLVKVHTFVDPLHHTDEFGLMLHAGSVSRMLLLPR